MILRRRGERYIPKNVFFLRWRVTESSFLSPTKSHIFQNIFWSYVKVEKWVSKGRWYSADGDSATFPRMFSSFADESQSPLFCLQPNLIYFKSYFDSTLRSKNGSPRVDDTPSQSPLICLQPNLIYFKIYFGSIRTADFPRVRLGGWPWDDQYPLHHPDEGRKMGLQG